MSVELSLDDVGYMREGVTSCCERNKKPDDEMKTYSVRWICVRRGGMKVLFRKQRPSARRQEDLFTATGLAVHVESHRKTGESKTGAPYFGTFPPSLHSPLRQQSKPGYCTTPWI